MTYLPGYPCDTCRRASNGYSISIPNQPVRQFCSHACARDFMRNPSLTLNERAAILAGGDLGGAYLDSIGKFDLTKLSAAEWAEFCGKIFLGATAKLQEIADDEIPF